MTTSATRFRTRADAWLFAPTDAVRIETFAWLLAWALLIYTLSWAQHAGEWLTVAGFHLRGPAMAGQQLDWPPLAAGRQWLVLGPYVAAMVIVIVRLGRIDRIGRAALGVMLVGLVTVTGIDRLSAFTFNKLALVSLAALVCVTPRAEGGRAGEPAPAGRTIASAWPLRVLQTTILLQYFGAGVCKLHGDWLAHSDVLWMQAQGAFRTETAAALLAALPQGAWTGMQWLALAFELAAPVLLIVPRLRPLGFAWGAGMLLMIGLTMAKVGYFTFMIGTYFVLFAPPEPLGRLMGRLRGPPG